MSDRAYDELGPEKVLELHSAKTGLTAIVVVDNTALGPAMGGVRVSAFCRQGRTAETCQDNDTQKLYSRTASRWRKGRNHR